MPDRQKKKPVYSEEEATRWLSWLARGMQRHGQTVFLIEQLQPSWLSGRPQLVAYTLASRIAIAASLGILVVVMLILPVLWGEKIGGMGIAAALMGLESADASALPSIFLMISLLLGSGVAVVDLRRLRGGRIWDRAGGLAEPWRGLAFLVIYLAGLTSLGFVLILFDRFMLPVLFFAFLGALIWGSRAAGLGQGSDISTVETLGWSWAGAGKGVLSGFVKGLVTLPLLLSSVVLVIGTIMLLVMESAGAIRADAFNAKAVRRGFLIALGLAGMGIALLIALGAFPLVRVALGLGLCGAVIGGIFGGLQGRVVALKTLPNQGIRLSLKNALTGGCLLALPFGLLGAVAGLWMTQELNGFFYGVAAALTAGYFGVLWYGGVDVVHHFILRLILSARGALPLRLSRFLDYAADELHFLQKVGGGYMFIHRYLQEHFAEVGEPAAGEPGKAAEPAAAITAAG
jgi:hypothetical protein